MKIERFSGFNISGLCRVKFTYASRVKSISYPDEYHQVTIELKSGFDFDEILFTRGIEDAAIDEIRDDTGSWYKALVKLINPRLEASKAFKDGASSWKFIEISRQ